MSDVDKPVINPASPEMIKWMGIVFLVFAIFVFYVLITTWPIPVEVNELGKVVKKFKRINIFGFVTEWAPDRHMLFTVMAAGAVGSLTHTLTSFGDYVGNRELSTNWIWFLILRVPIGIALAVLFYFIIRGGLLIPTVQTQGNATNPYESTLILNPYAIAAFSALAGMFSKQATDKLGQVFDAVFALKKPVDREGALGSSRPIKFAPPTLIRGKREDLTVTASGFQKETKATINGKNRDFQLISETQIMFAIVDADVAKIGKLELVITNPNGDTFKGAIDVVEPGATKPVVTKVEPQLTKGMTPLPQLTVKGSGFQPKCTATINKSPRDVPSIADSEIKIAITAEDVKDTGKLTLVAKNPDGASSDPFEIEVK